MACFQCGMKACKLGLKLVGTELSFRYLARRSSRDHCATPGKPRRDRFTMQNFQIAHTWAKYPGQRFDATEN